MSWCTIESDPGVFTDLLESIGVHGLQVEELYSLDPSAFSNCERVYGLVFLFKWRPNEPEDRVPFSADDLPHVFFANQVISNACATQALLAIVMNLENSGSEEFSIGSELTQLKDFTAGMPPEMRGLAINNSDVIRNAHNSYAPQQVFDMESGPKDKDDDDIFHFVAYVPVQGIVYELDGLKEGPFVIGPVADDTNPLSWLDVVRPALEERIARYASNEIRFNLMAIVPNKTHQLQRLRARYLQEGNDSMIAEVDRSLQDEQARRAEWAKENQRRRWNYVPFLMTMLRILSEKGELTPMIRQALASSNQQQTSSNNKPTME